MKPGIDVLNPRTATFVYGYDPTDRLVFAVHGYRYDDVEEQNKDGG